MPITHDYKLTIMKQSRMAFLSIKLVIIENNSSLMHRKYHDFYAVHVYLQSIRISLLHTLLTDCPDDTISGQIDKANEIWLQG